MELDFSQFNLTKVKLIKDGGLEAHWTQTIQNGAITDTEEDTKKSTRAPHPDLVTKITTLKMMLAKLWGYNDPKTIVENEKFKGTPEQIDKMKKEYLEQLKSIEVTGVVVRGSGEKMSVNITGKRKMNKGIFQGMNSPRIQLNQKIYGFENDLEDLVPDIKEEVFEYLFKGKCENPTLFGEDQQAGEKNETKNEAPKDEKKEEKPKKRKKGERQPAEPGVE